MSTIKDVAKEAGVSIATVSYVVNDTRYVSPDLTRRVKNAIKKLDYKPNVVARGLKTKKTQTIGFISSDISNPFYSPLVKGIEDYLAREKYSLIICNTDENVEKEKIHVDILIQKNIDGLIIAPTGKDYSIFEKLINNKIPYVCVDRKIEGYKADMVLSDNITGAYEITRYLLESGHRNIGIIVDDIQSGEERLYGYKKALEEFEIPIKKELIIYGIYNTIGGFEATNKLLSLNDKPTAIFSTMNLMTIGAMKAIISHGYNCPEDISLAGFDDFEWASVFKPELTTVAQFPHKIGKKAADILIKRIKNPEIKYRQIRVPTELIIRKSTKELQ